MGNCFAAPENEARQSNQKNPSHVLGGDDGGESTANEDEALFGGLVLEEDDGTEEKEKKGEQFMAVKPWLGAMKAPTDWAPNPSLVNAPSVSFSLEWLYGYHSAETFDNIHLLASGKVAYFSAAVGVVYDPAAHTQNHYRGHNDDILCIAAHPNGRTVATGQIAHVEVETAVVKKRTRTLKAKALTSLHIWDAESCENVQTLKNFQSHGIAAMAFSPSGDRLATAGLDNDHCVHVFDWQSKHLVAKCTSGKENIFCLSFRGEEEVVSCGIKHIKFFSIEAGRMSTKMGLFAPLDRQSVIGISVDPTNSGQVFAAMGSGVLACFSGRSMKRQVQAHKGPCMAVKATQDGVYSVGKDGMAIKWDKNLGSKITSWKNPGDHGLRSISVKEDIGTIVIGTEESVAVKLDMNLQGANTLFEAHFDDELWGLSMHPTDCNLAATVSRDRSIRIWDLAGHKQVKRLDLPFQKRVRNASASGGGADVCAWSGDGAYLACGLLCGDVVIFKTSDWTQHSKVSLPTNSKTPQISDIKFCPDWENNAQMAVGSHDNMVYLFNDLGEEDLNMKPTRDECVKCRAHSSYITHLDYNKEGSMIHTNCGAYELLFFNTETGKQEGYGASNTKDDDWASWTAVLGWPVQGIFPPFSDGTDVNACHKAHNSDLLATSDDFGRVNLYNWPCLNRHWTGKKWEGEMNGAVQLEGHSSHVTNVRFSLDDSKLLSCGGNDKSVFQWVQDN